MAYDIFKRAIFTKISDDQFIATVEVADSNVYEFYWGGRNYKQRRERRSFRQLNIFWHKGERYVATRNEIMAYPKQILKSLIERYPEVPEKDLKKMFGYYAGIAVGNRSTHATTYGMFEGLFLNGMKRAL